MVEGGDGAREARIKNLESRVKRQETRIKTLDGE